MDISEITAQRLLQWSKGFPQPPVKIHLMPTDRCNLKCLSCWRWSGDTQGQIPFNSDELSDEKLLSLIDEAADLGVLEIELCGGGEPLFRKNIAQKIMERIKLKKMRGNITTNATLLTEEDVRRLVDIGWDQLIISLDGPDARINDFLRPPEGTFEKVTRVLGWFRDHKASSGKNKPEIIIQCVLSKINIRQVAPMFDLAAQYKVTRLIFEPAKILSPLGGNLALAGESDYQLLRGQLEEAIKLGARYGIESNFASFNVHPELIKDSGKLVLTQSRLNPDFPNEAGQFLRLPCYEPWYRMYITNFGITSFCCMADYSNIDTVKQKTLQDIWTGEYFSQARSMMAGGELPKSCASCQACLFGNTQFLQELLYKYTHDNK